MGRGSTLFPSLQVRSVTGPGDISYGLLFLAPRRPGPPGGSAILGLYEGSEKVYFC
jgi:hypothetical protein